MSKKTKKDNGTKTLSLSHAMMGDLLFVLKPLKEKQLEYMFWQNQLREVENDILKSEAIDSAKWNCNWQEAFVTGKLVCTLTPQPKPIIEKEGEKKNGKSKNNHK